MARQPREDDEMTNGPTEPGQRAAISAIAGNPLVAACLAVLILLAGLPAGVLARQQDTVIEGSRPLWPLLDLLVAKYGAPVTLEEPYWRGGAAERGNGLQPDFFALDKEIRLVVPAYLLPEAPVRIQLSHLRQILALYNRDGVDPIQFDAVSSEWGLHIVPLALRTESGEVVRVPSPLDAPVKVERKRRLASEHFRALCEALSASVGFRIAPFGQYMDGWFAAWGRVPPKHATALLSEKELEPYKFVWGGGRDHRAQRPDQPAETVGHDADLDPSLPRQQRHGRWMHTGSRDHESADTRRSWPTRPGREWQARSALRLV